MDKQTPEKYELSAQILIRYFGWRWWKEKKRSLIGLYPPENDILGYTPTNWSTLAFDDVHEEVETNPSKYERFFDWWRGCSKTIKDGYTYEDGIPLLAENRIKCIALLDRIRELELIKPFLSDLVQRLGLGLDCDLELDYQQFEMLCATPRQICESAIAAMDFRDRITSISDQKKCVHTEHCCIRHGCKYGDTDCPVAEGRKRQSYPCEYCNDSLPWE